MIQAMRISDRHWWMIIFVLWAMAMTAPSLNRFIPSSVWMSVHSIHVDDAKAGEVPTMRVERTIRREFRASWVAEVERLTLGGFEILPNCVGRGTNSYSPDARLPARLDLDWWLFPTACKLHPGQYRLETRWTLSGGQEVRALSNIFTVTP